MSSTSNIGSAITKKLDNAAIGMLVAAWGLDGYLAYKFWGKSLVWKAGIVALTAVNAYSTMKYLKKIKENAGVEVQGDDKQSLVNEIASKALSKAEKAPTKEQKDELIKKISTLSVDDLKVAKEYVTELVAIDFKQAPEISMKKFKDLVIRFNGKYGMDKMQKIGDILK